MKMIRSVVRSVPFMAAMLVASVLAARAIVIWSPQVGDVNMPGLSPTSLGTYVKVAPATGFSYSFDRFQTRLLIRPAGTLAAGTVTLSAAPFDGAESCLFSTQTVSSLTFSAGAGQTINNAVSTILANTRVCYVYSLANTTWDRSQ